MRRILVRTIGLAALVSASAVGVVHMASGGIVTAGGGGHEPCMVYANDKTGGTDGTDYTTQPPPECPPPDCEHALGYDDGHTTRTYKPPECDTTTSMMHDTKPPKETTTTAGSGGGDTTTTKPPTPGLFSVKAVAFCGSDFLPEIAITFGNRPDLDGQRGVLSFSTGGSVFLTFQSNTTVNIPYPNTTQNVNLIYSLGQETATASVTYPGDCSETTTTRPSTSTSTSTSVSSSSTSTTTGGSSTSTTSTTINGVTTTVTSTTINGVTTTTRSTTPPTGPTTPTTPGTLPPTFQFGAATTVCIAEVPTIEIVFQNLFPELAGRTGTLTMSDVNGNVVSVQPLVYQPGQTVHILYPGTRVNPDGSIADVPGWNLNADGFWVRDPSDEFLRDGIQLTYTVNPTATAFVTYPPESSTCANPSGPFPPAPVPPPTTPHGGLPPTL